MKRKRQDGDDDIEERKSVTIESLAKQIEDLKSRFQKLEETFNENKTRQSDRVVLNIGGTRFTTSILTLTTDKDSFFSGMFSEVGHQQPDEYNEYFIDRSPTHFPIILNFLRGYDVEERVSSLDAPSRRELEDDIDYYNIRDMFDLCPRLLRKQVPI
jgi:dsDNA-specific endonuclease/ATPase MutS2